MFKLLMGRFAGKPVPPPTATAAPESAKAASPTSPANARDDELIKAYDGYGREMQMRRGDWREKVLLPSLKANWDNPDALYSLIISGLNDGELQVLEAASRRLWETDSQIERGHVTHGIVLLRLKRLDEAETVFRDAVNKVGETGTLLTNLAKIEAERGEQSQAEATLWRAIQLDPNLDNGLMWWAAIHKEREGEQGYVRALANVATLPDSWRAQLWLARHYLQNHDIAVARSLYEEVLAGGRFGNEALMMISGDLGNNGQVPLLVELIAPVFDPQKHDMRAGMNLLQAYLHLRKLEEGEALLSRLYAVNAPPFKPYLDRSAQDFQRLKAEGYAVKPVDEKALEIVTVPFDVPIWMYGLRDPAWLFNRKDEHAKKVVFLSLAAQTKGGETAQQQRENELGRLSRGIPLYLAEAVHFWTEHKGLSFVPVVRGGGPVLFGASDDDAPTVEAFKATGDFIVLGTVGEQEGRWRVVCKVWSVEAASWIAREECDAAMDDLPRAILALEQRILAALGGARPDPLDACYARPEESAVNAYLSGLGQSLTLSLVANQLTPRENLWDERSLVDWWLRVALHWNGMQVAGMAYLAALSNAAEYGSPLLAEFVPRTRELIKDSERAGRPVARLAPVAWKALGMTTELEKAMDAAGRDADEAYREWLERVVHHQRKVDSEQPGEANS
jgi:tetratricopeptide (TPR) repeat protein